MTDGPLAVAEVAVCLLISAGCAPNAPSDSASESATVWDSGCSAVYGAFPQCEDTCMVFDQKAESIFPPCP